MTGPDLAWQPSLLDGGPVRFDATFAGVRRRHLDADAWVDEGPGWCGGADGLFARLLACTPWRGRTVRMYEHVVAEPRLTHRWLLDEGGDRAGSAPAHPPQGQPAPDQGPPDDLVAMAAALSDRYGVRFTQIGVNLYRDGTDSVAWHGDRVARELPEAVVALVSLGAVRPFRLRPTGGGPSVLLRPGPGDLLVMGGSCQRTWQHAVPKCRGVGPRISVQFRHAYR